MSLKVLDGHKCFDDFFFSYQLPCFEDTYSGGKKTPTKFLGRVF